MPHLFNGLFLERLQTLERLIVTGKFYEVACNVAMQLQLVCCLWCIASFVLAELVPAEFCSVGQELIHWFI